MVEALVGGYWCYMCTQRVNPIIDLEAEIKCPICNGGFVEEMGSDNTGIGGGGGEGVGGEDDHESDQPGIGSDQAFALWAQILLGMMETNPMRRRRRHRRYDDEDDELTERSETQVADNNSNHETDETEEVRRRFRDIEREMRGISDLERQARSAGDLERDLESINSRRRRRRRSSAAILQLLQGLQNGETSSEPSENTSEGDSERVIMIDPFNQSIILQASMGGNGSARTHVRNQSNIPGALGDYLIGPNLELLLQHLAENDPNMYGTPPAQKEAVQAMPTVNIAENLQCSICLEDFEFGAEAKEMPCNHKFHDGCILPWLDLHSSCPVCRFQMPVEDHSSSDVNRE